MDERGSIDNEDVHARKAELRDYNGENVKIGEMTKSREK